MEKQKKKKTINHKKLVQNKVQHKKKKTKDKKQ